MATALKDIYRAMDAEAGKAALAAFAESSWGRKYAAIVQSWERAWEEVIPFYAFPAEVQKLIYTTNAIEALNARLRQAVRALNRADHAPEGMVHGKGTVRHSLR